MRYLLDTNILSEPMRQTPNPRVMEKLREYSSLCSTSATVWHELLFGCVRLPSSRRRHDLEDYLKQLQRSQLPILPYDRVAARRHAELRAEMQSQGHGCGQADGEIAAVAMVHQLVLVTNNIRHFEMIPGLILENWFTG